MNFVDLNWQHLSYLLTVNVSFLYLLPSVIATEIDSYFTYDAEKIETTTIGIDPYFYYDDWCEMIPSVQIHCMYLEMY